MSAVRLKQSIIERVLSSTEKIRSAVQRLQQQPDLHAVSYMNMMMTPATPAVLLASYVLFHKGNCYGGAAPSLSNNDDRKNTLVSTYLIFIFMIVRLSQYSTVE